MERGVIDRGAYADQEVLKLEFPHHIDTTSSVIHLRIQSTLSIFKFRLNIILFNYYIK